MKCEECLTQVEEYLEKRVDLQFAEHVLAHLSGCAECRREHEYLKKEQQIFSAHLVDVKASASLWAAIEAEIEVEKTRRVGVACEPARIGNRLMFFFHSLQLKQLPAISFAVLLIGISLALSLVWLADKKTGVADNLAQNSAASDENVTGENGAEKETGRAVGQREFKPEKPTFRPLLSARNRRAVLPEKTSIVAKLVSDRRSNRTISPAPQPTKTKYENVAINGAKYREQTSAAVQSSPAAPPRAGELELETSRQVEKAQLLLRSFRNTPLAEDAQTFDVAYDRRQARALLQSNITLRLRAESEGQFEIEGMLARLEPYLIDIANLRGENALDEVRAIKTRIREQEIVASLQVYSAAGRFRAPRNLGDFGNENQ